MVDLGLGPALERRLVRAAAAVGLGFHALDSFRQGDLSHAGLLLGDGRQEPDALRRAVDLLEQLVSDLEASTGGARRAETGDRLE